MRSGEGQGSGERENNGRVIVEFEESVIVPCSPSVAFVIADMGSLADWNPAVVRSVLVAGQALVEGARYECTLARGPMRLRVSPVLREVVPDELVRYAGKFGFAHSEDSIRFRSHQEGTRITFRNVSALPGWARPFRGVIQIVFHRQAGRAVVGAVRYLEQHAPRRG